MTSRSKLIYDIIEVISQVKAKPTGDPQADYRRWATEAHAAVDAVLPPDFKEIEYRTRIAELERDLEEARAYIRKRCRAEVDIPKEET